MYRITAFLLYLVVSSPAFSQDAARPADALGTNALAATNQSFPERRPSARHLLAAGDLIEVKVYQEEDLNRKEIIDTEGYVRLPLLDRVKVGGKTIEEAIAAIRDLLEADYLYDPQVSVSLVEIAKGHFSILGQVPKAGPYEIMPNAKLDLLDAIAMAGGFTRLANQKRVIVKRTSVDNMEELHTLNAADMAKKKNAKPFAIKPGDTIIVPESRY